MSSVVSSYQCSGRKPCFGAEKATLDQMPAGKGKIIEQVVHGRFRSL